MILCSDSFFSSAVVTIELLDPDVEDDGGEALSMCVCGATLHESDGPAGGPADEFECVRGHKWRVRVKQARDPRQLSLSLGQPAEPGRPGKP